MCDVLCSPLHSYHQLLPTYSVCVSNSFPVNFGFAKTTPFFFSLRERICFSLSEKPTTTISSKQTLFCIHNHTEYNVAAYLCPSCGQVAHIAAPSQGLVLAWGGLVKTLTGYRLGIKLVTPTPKICSLTTTLFSHSSYPVVPTSTPGS